MFSSEDEEDEEGEEEGVAIPVLLAIFCISFLVLEGATRRRISPAVSSFRSSGFEIPVVTGDADDAVPPVTS